MYDPKSIVSVREVAVIVKDLLEEEADAYPALAVIEDEIVHVPASTNVTTPLDESTVQTEVVELEYDFVPEPADGVADIVGGESDNAYGPASPDNVRVRESDVIEKLIEDDVADE